MKKIIAILILIFSFTLVMALEETLITGKIESGGYGGPIVQFSQIDGNGVIFSGGRGGWIINHTYSVGGAGYGLVNEVKVKDEGKDRTISLGYGGLLIQYIGNSDKLIHYNVGVLVGAGGINYVEVDNADSFAVVQPELEMVLNVSEFFRLSAGAGYRFAFGSGEKIYDNKALSGLNAMVGFNFGKF